MADGATLDISQIKVICAGRLITGFATGTYLNVSYDVDAFQKLVGIDGEGAFVKTANRAATITLTLIQTAQGNSVLSALHLLDLATPGGLMFPFQITELGGQTIFSAARARAIRLPDSGYSDTGETRAWAIGTTHLLGAVGGRAATPIIGAIDPDNLIPG